MRTFKNPVLRVIFNYNILLFLACTDLSAAEIKFSYPGDKDNPELDTCQVQELINVLPLGTADTILINRFKAEGTFGNKTRCTLFLRVIQTCGHEFSTRYKSYKTVFGSNINTFSSGNIREIPQSGLSDIKLLFSTFGDHQFSYFVINNSETHYRIDQIKMFAGQDTQTNGYEQDYKAILAAESHSNSLKCELSKASDDNFRQFFENYSK